MAVQSGFPQMPGFFVARLEEAANDQRSPLGASD
jgi:hypothetical protein